MTRTRTVRPLRFCQLSGDTRPCCVARTPATWPRSTPARRRFIPPPVSSSSWIGGWPSPRFSDVAIERFSPLLLVTVHGCRIPVVHLANGAWKCAGQGLGGVAGASHGELDLLVDLAGQTPSLILRPHEVGLLSITCRRAVPSQLGCVSQRFDTAGEEQHFSVGNIYARRQLYRRLAAPAFPYRRVSAVRGGRMRSERHQCCANGINPIAWRDVRVWKRDAHVHIKARWAVPN
jgi:hypothetical protein